MLYPDFNDLVSFKDRKLDLIRTPNQTVKSTIPGNYHSPFRGRGLEFDSVREYVPGDDIRNIDWRVTARTGSPHLKLFKDERERHTIICVDMNSTMRFGTRNTFKSVQAARIAALLGWRGLAQHDRVSACLFGDVPNGIQLFAPKRTRKSFCTMLKMLTEPFADRHSISLPKAFEEVKKASHTGSLIYLISDFMDANLPNEASLNQKCDIVFIAVNDPADRSIYPLGTIGFCAYDREKVTVDTDSLAGREAYNILWKENRKKLYETTSKFKIPLIELTTESNIHRDLIMGLKAISKKKKR